MSKKRTVLPALAFALSVAVGFAIMYAQQRNLSARLATSEGVNQVLAQQVRDMGGVPKVTPQPGRPGSTGKNGQPGSPGTPGQNGTPGHPGSTGKNGTPGSPGASGPPGSPGNAGQQGPVGPAGPPGKDGSDGADGKDGKDGSPPSGWTFTYLGVTYQCSPTSEGATTYTCQPDSGTPTSRRRR